MGSNQWKPYIPTAGPHHVFSPFSHGCEAVSGDHYEIPADQGLSN